MRNPLRNILCVYWEWRAVHFFRITLNEKFFNSEGYVPAVLMGIDRADTAGREKASEGYVPAVLMGIDRADTAGREKVNVLCLYWEWRYVHFFRITLNEKSFEKYSLCLLRVKIRSLLQNNTEWEIIWEIFCLFRVKIRSLLQNNTEWEILWEIFSVFIESEDTFTSSE